MEKIICEVCGYEVDQVFDTDGVLMCLECTDRHESEMMDDISYLGEEW